MMNTSCDGCDGCGCCNYRDGYASYGGCDGCYDNVCDSFDGCESLDDPNNCDDCGV